MDIDLGVFTFTVTAAVSIFAPTKGPTALAGVTGGGRKWS